MSSIAAAEKQLSPIGGDGNAPTACTRPPSEPKSCNKTPATTRNEPLAEPIESTQLANDTSSRRADQYSFQVSSQEPPKSGDIFLASNQSDKTDFGGGGGSGGGQRNESPSQQQQSDSSRRSSGSGGKFKDKRPEPLKLNPNPNQEIPLDLTVKR